MIILILVISLMLYLSIIGYYHLLVLFKNNKNKYYNKSNNKPCISIYMSVFNEEENIKSKLDNIQNLNYPKEKIEFIIVSDGSYDNTNRIIKTIKDKYSYKIKLIDKENNKGQYYAQNYVKNNSSYKLLLSTDASTIFDYNYLNNITKYINNENIGYSCGVTKYVNKNKHIENINKQRDIEYKIRKLQSKTLNLINVDGNNLLYKKEICEELEKYEDIDQIVMLLAKKYNKGGVHIEDAICYEYANDNNKKEIISRSRMTRKALLSFYNRWRLAEHIKYPIFTLNYYLHKINRFMMPIYLLLFIVMSIILIMDINKYILVAIGAIGTIIFINKYQIIKSLISANIGFILGIIGFIRNNKEGKYHPTKIYGNK